MWKCLNVSECIGESWVCDGRNDCSDGSDEKNCTFCKKDKKMIKQSSLCDGLTDCLDGSDEKNCTICNGEKTWKCPNDPKCIWDSWLCDGRQSDQMWPFYSQILAIFEIRWRYLFGCFQHF